MDEPGPLPAGDDDPPPARPSAFGLPARPLGCGIAGGALFALAFAPVALLYAIPER